MSSGFVFDDRHSREPRFPDHQLVNVGELTRQHQVSKLDEDRNLSELDKLRKRAAKGGLW